MIFFTDSAAFGGHGSGLRSRQAGFKAENARHSGLADRRDGAGAPCAEPAGPADAGRGLVRQCGTPFGVRCGPDDRHRAAVEKAAQCRAADPGHHRDRIAGHLCSGQPGVCLRVPHHGRAGLSGVFVRRHRAGHSARALAFHCERAEDQRPGDPHPHAHGRAG